MYFRRFLKILRTALVIPRRFALLFTDIKLHVTDSVASIKMNPKGLILATLCLFGSQALAAPVESPENHETSNVQSNA